MADAGESFAVIGGEGFVGAALVSALQTAYPQHAIASFGLTQRTFTPGYRFFRTDITSPESVAAALSASGATTVFHTASPFHDADRALCETVNVGGTEAVIEACLAARVKKLVFTSSVTVVHGGDELCNVDERLPRTTSTKDHYAYTKAEAERLVLEANGEGELKTCSLRLAGIIGPGDRQVLPNFIKVWKAGQGVMQIGENLNQFDFVDVRNVAHAHLLAATALSAPPLPIAELAHRLPPVHSTVPFRPVPTSDHLDPSVPNPHPDPPLPAHRNRYNQFHGVTEPLSAAGEAFVISNGEPVPFWSLAKAVYFAYSGKELPFVVRMNRTVGMGLAYLSEAWAWATRTNIHDVGLTTHRVGYVCDHMFFDIEKARRVLKYEPIISLEQSIKDGVAWAKEQELKEQKKKDEAKSK